MAYEHKPLLRGKVIYDNDNATNPLVYQMHVNGEKVEPTSATITVYRRGVSTALLSAQAMTVDGSLLKYSVDTTTEATWPIEEGYRAELAITYNATVYKRHLIFDVVRFLFVLEIGIDRLEDIDSRVGKMLHGNDSDFSGLIEGVRGLMQTRIESKVKEDDKLVENMILDTTPLEQCAVYWILAHIWHGKDNDERDWFMEQFEQLFGAVISTIRYDDGQDGDEDPGQKGISTMRLVT